MSEKMVLKKRGCLVGMIFALMLMNFASASISFTDVQPAYNIGDIIEAQISVSPIQPEYMLKMDLYCSETNILSYNPGLDNAGKGIIKIPLTYNTIKDFSGNCYFKAEYAGEIQKSRIFEISRKINIILNIDSFVIKPGDSVVISGHAQRMDSSGVNGAIEAKIPIIKAINNSVISNDTNLTQQINQNFAISEEVFSGSVSNGNFSITRSFPRDIPAGSYNIEIKVYENSASGKLTNQGLSYASLRVLQVLSRIDIALSEFEIVPGQNISFRPILLDQAGGTIIDDVSSIIRNNETNLFEKITKSEETLAFNIPTDMSSGYYEIRSSSGNFTAVKTFFVKEKAMATFLVANSTLFVNNIGNIPYNKDIEIDFAGENGESKSFIKKIILEVGESKEFKLTGLNERYNIRIGDGTSQMVESGVVLTGNAIGIRDVRDGTALILSQPIVWIFLILILAGIIFFLYRDYFRRKSIARPFDSKSKFISNLKSKEFIELKGSEEKREHKEEKAIHRRDFRIPLGEQSRHPAHSTHSSHPINHSVHHMHHEEKKEERKNEEPRKKLIPSSSSPTEAEQSLVSHGQKNVAVVLIIKIKNNLSKTAKEYLDKAVESVYSKIGAVLQTRDFVYIIFSPAVTKTFKNEATAARCAEKIANELREYNNMFKDKIHFGIGINTGEIINKVEHNKLKFTALGNLLPIAKRLADSADNGVLLSKESYQRGLAEIKAVKKHVNGTEAFEIKQVVDYDKNKKFIDEFMRRQGRA